MYFLNFEKLLILLVSSTAVLVGAEDDFTTIVRQRSNRKHVNILLCHHIPSV